MRRNGLQMPLEPLQVFTWSLLLVMIVEFYAIVVPGLERGPAIGLGCLYGVFAVGCTIMGFMACKVDPMDHNVGAHAGAGSSTQERTFCFLCQVHVNKGSRHCRYCDKCVARFDHHCRWLNNCIGGTNYRYFVMLLVSTLGLTGLQLALSIWLIVLFHTQSEGDPLYQRIDDRYGSLSSDGYIIIVYVFAVMVLPFVGLLIQLIGFHMMLAREGLTTYDYIIREQKREREKREKRARKEAGAQAAREARSSTHGRSSVTNDEGRDAPLAATAGRQQTRPRSMVADKFKPWGGLGGRGGDGGGQGGDIKSSIASVFQGARGSNADKADATTAATAVTNSSKSAHVNGKQLPEEP